MTVTTPPRGSKGGVLFACTLGNSVSVTPAVHAVFGLFLVPLTEAFGWNRASVSGVLGILALVGAVTYPLIGRYVDTVSYTHLTLPTSDLV